MNNQQLRQEDIIVGRLLRSLHLEFIFTRRAPLNLKHLETEKLMYAILRVSHVMK